MDYVYGNVNGKKVVLPRCVSINDIVRASGKSFNPNTRCIIQNNVNGNNKRLKNEKKYLINPNDKFLIGPDRVKA